MAAARATPGAARARVWRVRADCRRILRCAAITKAFLNKVFSSLSTIALVLVKSMLDGSNDAAGVYSSVTSSVLSGPVGWSNNATSQ